ncbi:MAG: hypothetical protein WDW36_004115 [Sanguina aurantia]
MLLAVSWPHSKENREGAQPGGDGGRRRAHKRRSRPQVGIVNCAANPLSRRKKHHPAAGTQASPEPDFGDGMQTRGHAREPRLTRSQAQAQALQQQEQEQQRQQQLQELQELQALLLYQTQQHQQQQPEQPPEQQQQQQQHEAQPESPSEPGAPLTFDTGHTYIAWQPSSESLSPQEAEDRCAGHPGSYMSHALYAGAGAARREGSLATRGEDAEDAVRWAFSNKAATRSDTPAAAAGASIFPADAITASDATRECESALAFLLATVDQWRSADGSKDHSALP